MRYRRKFNSNDDDNDDDGDICDNNQCVHVSIAHDTISRC